MDNMIFNTTWDNKLITSSVIVTTILTGSLILMLYLGITRIQGWFKLFCFAYSIICVIVIFLCYLYSTQVIILNEDFLLIKRLINDKKISITEIEDIQILENKTINSSIRLFGSGGLFGYFGYFKNPKLGKYMLFATRNNNFVLVKTADHKYVITPDKPELLVEKVRNLLQ